MPLSYIKLSQGFVRGESGSVATIFCVCCAMFVFSVGLAIDYARAYHAKSALQLALDAGVLAAAKLANNPDAAFQTMGASYFQAKMAEAALDAELGHPSFVKSGTTIVGTVKAKVNTTLLKMAGLDAVPIGVQSTASLGGKGMELMLVVDVSGSMGGGSKIGALRTAATKLVDTIYGDGETRPDTWIGITPFSGRVNFFDYGAAWMTGAGPNWPNRLCADRRSSPNVENDEPPSAELFPHYWATSGYGGTDTCPAPRALGLTAQKSIIKTRIATLDPTAGTSTQDAVAQMARPVGRCIAAEVLCCVSGQIRYHDDRWRELHLGIRRSIL